MITEARGNLLEADVDALVNTVNTVGIMGKGIALQFKRAFPAMFREYERAAKSRELALGRMHVWPTQQMTGPRYVINFPTKSHWKSRSKLTDIDMGLDALVATVRELQIRSIAVPPLGCGNGGLDWAVVQPLMMTKLSQLPDVDVIIYPPNGAPAAAEMPNAERRPAMTPGRAALIALMSGYATARIGDALADRVAEAHVPPAVRWRTAAPPVRKTPLRALRRQPPPRPPSRRRALCERLWRRVVTGPGS